MAEVFAYSILAAVLFAVHSTTAFKLNIHDKMTKTERLAIFGSENLVPKYKVFPMSLSGMRPQRKASSNIRCTLSLNGKEIKLNLKPTAQYLATKYIPVWSANSDRHARNKIRYTPLTTAMRDVGEFTTYHDLKNKAALVVYKDRSEKIVIEGMIASRYTIRSLPKRLSKKLLNVVNDISEIPNVMGGTISSNKDLGFYAVITNPEALAQGVHNKSNLENFDRTLPTAAGARGKHELLDKNLIVPKAIYPEILVVLDHNAIRHRTITQALRFTLAFWNGIDMIFRVFDKPKIHLNIAGIIIAKDNTATPYLAKDTSVPSIGMDSVASEMTRHFYEERIRIPVKQYDIIMAMTTMTLCEGSNGSCLDSKFWPLFMNDVICQSERNKTVMSVMMMYYDANFGPAHILSLADDFRQIAYPVLMQICVAAHGHATPDNQNEAGSQCMQTVYSTKFAGSKTQCLRNMPRSIQPVDKVLPGRWLSMDGQCQNEGYGKSCKLKKKIGKCVAKGCMDKGSRCIRSKKIPLPGSKCGTHQYCNTRKKCL